MPLKSVLIIPQVQSCKYLDTVRYLVVKSFINCFSLLFTDITVANVVVPHDCNDNPYFANCKLIVKAEYCANVYYKKFCCRSCTDAGQIKHN